MGHRASTATAGSCFRTLSSEVLTDIESNSARSCYYFTCGCVIMRDVGDEEHCHVEWCIRHMRVAWEA